MIRSKLLLVILAFSLGASCEAGQAAEKVKALIPVRNIDESLAPFVVAKYLGYFDDVIRQSGGPYLTGRRISYTDLSLFQLVEGLRYAFPKGMAKAERKIARVVEVHDRVGERDRIKEYVSSERRIPFNEDGIFRHYPELDG